MAKKITNQSNLRSVTKNHKAQTHKVSKIDLIVPYDDDLDYIKEYDGDYGFSNAPFRFEFEMSPDGKHIIRSVTEVNPLDVKSTEELFIRSVKRIAELFGLDHRKPSIFKEVYRLVISWYTVMGKEHPITTLEELIKTGYFKTPLDVETFLMAVDNFTTNEDIVETLEVSNPLLGILKDFNHDNETDIDETELNYSESIYDSGYENFPSNPEVYEDDEMSEMSDNEGNYELNLMENEINPKIEKLLNYDRSIEEPLWDRLSAISKKLRSENLTPEERQAFEEEKKAILANIYRLREEFLIENDMSYEEYILLRREKMTYKNFGYVKYPIDSVEEENKVQKELFQLEEELKEVNYLIRLMEITPERGIYLDEKSASLESLNQRKEEIKKKINQLKKKMDPELELIEEIERLIEKVRCSGKNDGKKAYEASQKVQQLMKRLKDPTTRLIYIKKLDSAWKERKNRLSSI